MTLSIQTSLNQGRGGGGCRNILSIRPKPVFVVLECFKRSGWKCFERWGRAGKGKGIRPQMLRGRGWGGRQPGQQSSTTQNKQGPLWDTGQCPVYGPGPPRQRGQMSGPGQGPLKAGGRAHGTGTRSWASPCKFLLLILGFSLVLDRSVHHLRTGLLFLLWNKRRYSMKQTVNGMNFEDKTQGFKEHFPHSWMQSPSAYFSGEVRVHCQAAGT